MCPPPSRWRTITGRFWLDLLWLEFLEKVITLILPQEKGCFREEDRFRA